MDNQPVGLQGGHQLADGGGVGDGGCGHHGQGEARDQGAYKAQVTEDEEAQVDPYDEQGAGGAELVHVAPGHAVGGEGAGEHTG